MDLRTALGLAREQADEYPEGPWSVILARLAAMEAAVQTIRGEVDHADLRGYWSMDVGPVRAALDAVSDPGSPS